MSDHVETLKKVRKLLQNTPALQGREHVGLGIAFNNAIDHFDALVAEIQRINNIRGAIGGTPEIAEMYRNACIEFVGNQAEMKCYRPTQGCKNPASCQENGCSAVEAEKWGR